MIDIFSSFLFQLSAVTVRLSNCYALDNNIKSVATWKSLASKAKGQCITAAVKFCQEIYFSIK